MLYDPPDQGGIPLNVWKLKQRVRCLPEEKKIEIKKRNRGLKVLHYLAISASVLSMYYKKLKDSIILKDLSTHSNTISVLKKNIKTITSLYPELAYEFFDILHSADDIPKRVKYRKFLSKVLTSGAIQKTIPLGLFAMEKCLKK